MIDETCCRFIEVLSPYLSAEIEEIHVPAEIRTKDLPNTN
jgi:hypothetical protein